jgi:hypothetical protein
MPKPTLAGFSIVRAAFERFSSDPGQAAAHLPGSLPIGASPNRKSCRTALCVTRSARSRRAVKKGRAPHQQTAESCSSALHELGRLLDDRVFHSVAMRLRVSDGKTAYKRPAPNDPRF